MTQSEQVPAKSRRGFGAKSLGGYGMARGSIRTIEGNPGETLKRGEGPFQGRLVAQSLAILLVLLLALGLRVYHLDYQSLWSDEGISLQRAGLPLSEMLRTMPVEHAPGYFVLLHFWLAGAGSDDFALRFLSLWPSVLAVAIVYRLAADLGSRRAGIVAALLLATNAFQVWYAQEARMYSWLLATSMGGTWLLARLLSCAPGGHKVPAPRSRWYLVYWCGYVLLIAATIYLQHYGFLVPLAHSVFAFVWLWQTRDVRGFARWAAAGAAVLLLYLPWLPRFMGIFGFSGWREPLSPWQLPWRYLAAYTVGDAMPSPWHGWLPWVYLLLALAGAVAWWWRRRLAVVLLMACTVVPLAGALAIALRQPDYHERYTIMLSAPLILLSSVGLVAVPRSLNRRRNASRFPPVPFFLSGGHEVPAQSRERSKIPKGGERGQIRVRALAPVLAAFILSGLVGANAVALRYLYGDSRLHKPDYRAAALRIQQSEQAGDVILVDGPDPQKVFMHYYRGGAGVYDLRSLSQGAGEAEVDATLTSATENAPRAWALLYFHPPGPVQAWLARHGWPAAETIHNGIVVSLYGLPTHTRLYATATFTTPVAFGPELLLSGAEAHCEPAATEQDTTPYGANTVTCRAGELLRLTTHWQTLQSPPARKFSVRLQDAAGHVWAAEDYVPRDGFAPTEEWEIGQPASDQRGLLLPADLPPGHYQLTIRLYDAATGAAVPAATSPSTEDVVLAEIAVVPPLTPPDPASLEIPQKVDQPLNDELSVIGFGTAPWPLHSGQPGDLAVWWRVNRQLSVPYQAQVELLDQHGTEMARGLYPLNDLSATGNCTVCNGWQPGEIVREQYSLDIDPRAASGDYRLRLSLVGSDGRLLGEPQELGRVAVEARPRRYRLPTMAHPVGATLGDAVVLRGYDLDQGQDSLELTLYWQAKGRVPGRYKVFVHLVDANGQIAAQSDDFPAGGAAPTDSWLPGEVIEDRHRLHIPVPGNYHLFAGLYDPESGVRPPATAGDGQPIPDGAIPLGEVRMKR